MRTRPVIGLAAAVSLCALAAAAQPALGPQAPAPESAAAARADGLHVLTVGGGPRRYRLLDAQRGPQSAPLLVVLHGGGGDGAGMLDRFRSLAHREGVIVAAPDGLGRNDRGGTWNAGGCCGEALARAVDDVAFVRAVIDDVSARARVDRRRVYVAGFSNGGMLTHRVAAALGDRIAGAAVVAGALFASTVPARTPVPMLIVHGRSDAVVPYGGGMSGVGFVARAQTMPFVPVRQSVEAWRQANGCRRPPTQRSEGGLTLEVSAGCAAGSTVHFYDLENGPHRWPAGDAASAGLDASETIWSFFKALAR